MSNDEKPEDGEVRFVDGKWQRYDEPTGWTEFMTRVPGPTGSASKLLVRALKRRVRRGHG